MKPNSLIFLAVLLLLLHGGALAAPNSKQDSATVNPPPQATHYLHISTNPTLSDIYVNRSGIDFSTRPDYVSPNFVKIPQNDTTVRITLFQKGYSDTTINVTLSHKDTSFLIVSLRQSYDEDLIEAQDQIIAHRNRKSLGHKLILASAIPFVTSVVAAIVTRNYIKNAEEDRDAIQNSLIRNSDNYNEIKDSFNDNRSKAKTAKAIGGTSLGIGIVVLSAGLILSF